ncbi:MAG: DUF494 domain-containing protein [Coxiellaceae bacterium]|nr:MAG: DUF494 domain-containing protein [Coxiellaceae bacterium]
MKEEILEVLMYLFENHMQESCQLTRNQQELLEELRHAGFALEEIRCALNWLDGLNRATEAAQQKIPVAAMAQRVLATEEYDKIGPECWGFLLFLEQSGILDPVSRELVMDRLMSMEIDGVDLADVKWVTLMVLFNQPEAKAALRAMETLILDETLGGVH